LNTWNRIAEMLQAYREQQRSTWGDTDDVLIAKYLSGTCTSTEEDAVKQAAARHPALAELLQVLRAIAEAPLPKPILESIQMPAAAAVAPVRSAAASAVGIWSILGPAARLVEGLTAWLDEAGRVAAAGLKSVLDLPEPAFARAMKKAGAATRAGEAIWTIPLPEGEGQLTLTVARGASSGLWTLMIELDLPPGVTLDPEARLEISDEQGEKEVPGPLSNFLNKLIVLKEGAWQVRLLGVGSSDLLLPLMLGPSRSGSPS